MQHHKTQRTGQGFTLIELLVVIAIISILAAILFPVFARARESARRASCMSNVKQVALGVLMYNQDNDERMPLYYEYPASYAQVSVSNPIGWADSLQPYLKSTQVYLCPSVTNPAQGANLTQETPDPTQQGYSDYWMNILAMGQPDSAFSSPASTVLLGDGAPQSVAGSYSHGYCHSGAATWYFHSTSTSAQGHAVTYSCGSYTIRPQLAILPSNPGQNAAQRHLGGANFAFADGHVKWEKGATDLGPLATTMANVYSGMYSTETVNGAPTFSIE